MLTRANDPENVQRQVMAEKYGRTKVFHSDIDLVLGSKGGHPSATGLTSQSNGPSKPRINESITANAKEINKISDEIDDRLDVSCTIAVYLTLFVFRIYEIVFKLRLTGIKRISSRLLSLK